MENKIKVGLIGFGRTGKAVANEILRSSHFCLEWVLKRSHILDHRSVPEFLGVETNESGIIYSTKNIETEELLNNHPVDVIIDFSSNNSIYSYGKTASELGIKIVSAISHYSDKEKKLLKELSRKTAVFWSPNITLGVNFLIFASKMLQKIAPWTDVEIIEEHFKDKKGISGTAVKIAEALNVEKENINSVRAGGIVGKHEVIFGFPYQTVRLTHESISREAFGSGAMFAAKNIADKEKGFYNFEDLISPYFSL